jgi:uncharacterized protein
MTIQTLEALRTLYAAPAERAIKKQLPSLDVHCKQFIALSPFVVVATTDAAHHTDASPRGGAPGFVKVSDDGAVLIPDSPGNNRLDTLENIIATGRAGLLFMIPGIHETLRVNGRASLSLNPSDIALCTTEKRVPKLVIRVSVDAAYLHCAKAFMRSRLWDAAAQLPRSALPPTGRILGDHTGIETAPETPEEMARRYAPDL